MEVAVCRTPAVVYNAPSLRDSVKHMETGMLVEAGDIKQLAKAITHLLIDHELRGRFAENAYRYAQQHSWDKTAKTFLKIVKGAVHG